MVVRNRTGPLCIRVRPSADAKRGSCRVCFALYKPETEAAVCPLSKGRNRRSVVGVATAGQVYSGFNFSFEDAFIKRAAFFVGLISVRGNAISAASHTLWRRDKNDRARPGTADS